MFTPPFLFFAKIDLAEEFGLIKVYRYLSYSSVYDLSPQGHLFLADIKENNIWNKTKEVYKQIGTTSLNSIKEIATNVISNLITDYFQR